MPTIIKKLATSKRGNAAIEFALLAPVMIAAFFGVSEVADVIACSRRVATVASVSADLVAQATTITNADMNDIWAALSVVIRPYNIATSTVRISSVVADNTGKLTIGWSNAQRTTPYTTGAVAPSWIPANVVPANQSVIVSEVTYSYTSVAGMFLRNGMTVTDTFYLRPRRSLTVARVP